MADGFGGGFAAGFRSSYNPDSKRLKDILSLQREQFDWQKGMDVRNFGLQERGVAVQEGQLGLAGTQQEEVERNNQALEALQARQTAAQERKVDLDLISTLNTHVFDTTRSKGAREFMLDQAAKQMGLDPNSPAYKATKKGLFSLDPDEIRDMATSLTTLGVNAKPGEVISLAKSLLLGNITPDVITSLSAEPNLDVEEVLIPDPNDPSKKIRTRVPRADSVGMEAPPPTSMVSIENKAEGAEATGLAGLDVEDAKANRAAAQTATRVLPSVRTFRAALRSKRFTPGTAATSREVLSRAAEFVGMDPTAMGLGLGNPATAEVMESASNQIALSLADEMSRLTNMSLQFVIDTVPNLSRTAGGNELILDMLETGADRSVQINKLQERYINQYGSLRRVPEGVPTFFEARDRLIEDYAEEDDAFEKRIRTESERGAGVDWKKLPGIGEGAEMFAGPEAPSAANNWDGLISKNAQGQTQVYDGKQGKWMVSE